MSPRRGRRRRRRGPPARSASPARVEGGIYPKAAADPAAADGSPEPLSGTACAKSSGLERRAPKEAILSMQARQRTARRLALGAEALPEGGVDFRVWAPRRRRVEVVFEPGPGTAQPPPPTALEPEPDGYFAGVVEAAAPGSLYRFRLDGEGPYPDPASRFQPDGPHGPSQVVDPAAFRWTDAGWRGAAREGQVIYELHVGTFTPEGTWAAATAELAGAAGARRHDARGHAGRRVPRPLRLGLRRRRPLRPDPPLRRARRLAPLRRPGARPRPRR